MKKLLLFFVLLTFISINYKLNAQDISVEKFSKIPKYLDGCGCFFHLKKSDDKYIFVSVSKYSAMKIDGSMQKLKRITENNDKGYYGKFSNENYEVEIFGKKTGDYEEGSYYKGKITVRNKNTDAETTIKFVGGCGC